MPARYVVAIAADSWRCDRCAMYTINRLSGTGNKITRFASRRKLRKELRPTLHAGHYEYETGPFNKRSSTFIKVGRARDFRVSRLERSSLEVLAG